MSALFEVSAFKRYPLRESNSWKYSNISTLVSLIEGGEVIEGGCSFRPIFNRRGVLIEGGGCSRQPVFNRRGVFTSTSF